MLDLSDNDYDDRDVKVKDHCHIIGKYGGSAQRDCYINVKLNHKIPVAFLNLKNHDLHLTMQELDKFSLKIIPYGFKKYMSFNISNNLSFIDSIQFLNRSLDSLVKSEYDDFKYFSQ